LDEIDWSFMLVLPFRDDLSLILIDLHDGPWPDDRVHGSVGHAYKPIDPVSQIQVLYESDRNLSPDFRKSRQQAGLVELKIFTRAQRNDNRVVLFRGVRRELCLGRGKHGLVPAEVAQVAAKEGEDRRPMNVIDGAQCI